MDKKRIKVRLDTIKSDSSYSNTSVDIYFNIDYCLIYWLSCIVSSIIMTDTTVTLERSNVSGGALDNSTVIPHLDYDTLWKANSEYDRVVHELMLDKLDNINRQITDYYHAYVKPFRMGGHSNNTGGTGSGGSRYNNRYQPRRSPKSYGNNSGYRRSGSGSAEGSACSSPLPGASFTASSSRSNGTYHSGGGSREGNGDSRSNGGGSSKYKMGLSVLKAKSDPVKMELNDALNKLADKTVEQSVTTVVAAISGLEKEDDKKRYLDMLWSMIFHKMFTQSNFIRTHIRFITETLQHRELFHIHTRMTELLEETLAMLQDPEYFSAMDGTTTLLQMITSDEPKGLGVNVEPFEDDVESIANEYGQDTHKLETLYNVLGKLTAAFMANSRSDKNKLLAALYKNFQQMNSLLQWQPVNMVELNARLYYVIGFFTDNRSFIRGMARDYYKDMECQLETIKDQDIPTAVKYKIINCVDNIMQLRLEPTSSNGGNASSGGGGNTGSSRDQSSSSSGSGNRGRSITSGGNNRNISGNRRRSNNRGGK